jgi:hypothetical protein
MKVFIMSQEKFKEALVKTEKLTKIDLENGSWEKLYLGCIEEVGEFCRAYSIENKFFGKAHKQLDEPASHEAVDVVICALSLFFYGYEKRVTDSNADTDVEGLYNLIFEKEEVELENLYPLTLHRIVAEIMRHLSLTDYYHVKKGPHYLQETTSLVGGGFTLYLLAGGKKDEFTDIMLKKLEKWENNLFWNCFISVATKSP